MNPNFNNDCFFSKAETTWFVMAESNTTRITYILLSGLKVELVSEPQDYTFIDISLVDFET